MKRSNSFHALAVLMWVALPISGTAQQDVPVSPKPFTPAAVALPSSVDKIQAAKASVLVIPEADIFRGVELSTAQRETLSSNLRKAKFSAFAQKSFSAKDLAAQRLPSGELLQVMQQNIAPPTSPFGFADPCAVADYSEDQVSALRKVLASQLRAQGGDVDSFAANAPKDCRRKQMVYYMKAALLVAK